MTIVKVIVDGNLHVDQKWCAILGCTLDEREQAQSETISQGMKQEDTCMRCSFVEETNSTRRLVSFPASRSIGGAATQVVLIRSPWLCW